MVERIRAAGDDVAGTSRSASRSPSAPTPHGRGRSGGFEPARTVRPGQLTIELLAEEAR